MKSLIQPIIFALLIGCGGQEDGFTTHFIEGDPLEVKLLGAEPGVKVRVSAGNYKNGKREGHWVFYTKDGKKINWEANFQDGKKHGVVTYWHYEGRKSSETSYEDDKPYGPSKHYYENGNLSSASMWYTIDDTTYLNEIRSWKPNGDVCPLTNVKDGTGLFVTYDENGDEEDRAVYKDGRHID
jgi:antitoxin component YwqK of YwqJK toxin-antitoxin module